MTAVDQAPASLVIEPRAARRPAEQSSAISIANSVTWSIGVVSLLCLVFLAFLTVLSPLQQNRSQDLLYRDFRSQLAAATAPFGVEPIDPQAPVAIIDIDSIGLRQVVVEGTAGRDLQLGPGHARATVLPGQVGLSLVYGRSTTYGGPFAKVPDLEAGQTFDVVTGQGAFTYQVEGVRRDGDPEPPPVEGVQSRLTLVTTEGSVLRPGSTVYVDALLTSDPAVTPPRSAVLVPEFEGPMATDTSALLPLALWLLLLTGVAAFTVWGIVNWGKAQTWLIAVPLALAALWGACDSAALLLPNLM